MQLWHFSAESGRQGSSSEPRVGATIYGNAPQGVRESKAGGHD